MNSFKDLKIVVTGGTSGLGKALSLELDELGARVAVVARNKENLNALARERPRIIALEGDIANKESIYPIAGEAASRLGEIDILFNVASYLGPAPLRLLIDTECEDFEKVLQTNLLGPLRLAKALLPAMLIRGRGVVVNISSDAAVGVYPRWGAYSASKAALDQMSRVFDEELKSQGVRFLSIDPGDMNTPMHFAAIPEADPGQLRDPFDSAKAILKLIAADDFSQVRRSL